MKTVTRLFVALVAWYWSIAGVPAAAQDLTIAAASSLQPAFPSIVKRFERETGRRVTLTFGSSGNFFSQIQNGAPFDLFFSADLEYPTRLEASGLAARGSLYRYANGVIVLWARKDSQVDVARGLQSLRDTRIRRIAIANPQTAPYGRAAIAALRHEQLDESLREKFVYGENVQQAAQFVQSGNAEAGIIALSAAKTPALEEIGRYYTIPASFYPPIEQAVIIVNASPNKELARQFLEFIKRPEIGRVMADAGFAVP